jgi:nucleoid DNA-binding protein
MKRIYRKVSEQLGITEKEVEKIYRIYLNEIRKETKKNPEREIYFEKFGKFIPSLGKIKARLREAFNKRDEVKVKRHILTLRNLNYKPKK